MDEDMKIWFILLLRGIEENFKSRIMSLKQFSKRGLSAK